MDPLARGVFFGIDIHHNRAHFSRAVFEGLAFAQRDAIGLILQLGLPAEYLIATGGGSRSNLWKQILSNVTNLPVMINNSEHSAAYGASLLAAVSAGVFRNIEDACNASISLTVSATPEPEYRDRYDKSYNTFKSIYLGLKPVFATSR